MKWISVKKRFPENEGRERSKAVLVYCPNIECTFTACYNFEHGEWEYFAVGSVEIYEFVSHWMPLPKPPLNE